MCVRVCERVLVCDDAGGAGHVEMLFFCRLYFVVANRTYVFAREHLQRISLVYVSSIQWMVLCIYVNRFVYRFFEGCDCADKMCFHIKYIITHTRYLHT